MAPSSRFTVANLHLFNGLQVDLEILVVIDALEERPGICGLQFLGIFASFHHLGMGQN